MNAANVSMVIERTKLCLIELLDSAHLVQHRCSGGPDALLPSFVRHDGLLLLALEHLAHIVLLHHTRVPDPMHEHRHHLGPVVAHRLEHLAVALRRFVVHDRGRAGEWV